MVIFSQQRLLKISKKILPKWYLSIVKAFTSGVHYFGFVDEYCPLRCDAA
jgi:hypothetical protein